jgi:biotin carboxylase
MPWPGASKVCVFPNGLGLGREMVSTRRARCRSTTIRLSPNYYLGENRIEAILRMRRALREYQVRGIKTNISFHQWILRHPRFKSSTSITGFIDEEYNPKANEGS